MTLVSERRFGVDDRIYFKESEINAVSKTDWDILCDRLHKNASLTEEEKRFAARLSNLLLDIEVFDPPRSPAGKSRGAANISAVYDMKNFDGVEMNEVIDWLAVISDDDRIDRNERAVALNLFDFLEECLWTRAACSFEDVWGDDGDRVFAMFTESLESAKKEREKIATKPLPDVKELSLLFNAYCVQVSGHSWNAREPFDCGMVEKRLADMLAPHVEEVKEKDAFDGIDFDAPMMF